MKFSASSPTTIVIATRESQLALWQAEHVQTILRGHGHPVEVRAGVAHRDRQTVGPDRAGAGHDRHVAGRGGAVACSRC